MGYLDRDQMDARLHLPYEYVADHIDVFVPGNRTVTDPIEVGDALVDYLRRRLGAIAEASGGELGLMLSGGIDSILVAAVARSMGLDPYSVTVVASGEASVDGDQSVNVARALDLRHELFVMDSRQLLDEVATCIARLECDEVWEVMSAVPIRAAFERFSIAGSGGPVLTGTGADAIFAGGKRLTTSPASAEAKGQLDKLVQKDVGANFRRERLIPDFYERLLGDDHNRFVMLFQTGEAWELSQMVSPMALWAERNGEVYDKFALRLAAERLGVAPELVWTVKAPLQRSSGLVSALGTAARLAMSHHPGATTYTDPRDEDFDLFVARLALRFYEPLRTDLA